MSGLFDPLFDVIAALLAWFYALWPSYGMAIAFLTLTAVIAVTPLTLKSTRSMLQMQHHMPELKKIQNQHKGDRQAMNEATMGFYKERGINPAGCLLPMLVQGPIFLVMYRVVNGLTRRTTEIGTQLGFSSRRYADSVFGQVPEYTETPLARGGLSFDPDFLSRDTDLYNQLSDNDEMVSWGVDLAQSASSAISEGVVGALPYLGMILVVLVTSLYQQRQIQGRQSGGGCQPAAADDDEDHPLHAAGDLLRDPGCGGDLLHHFESCSHRSAGVHNPLLLQGRGLAWSTGRQAASHGHG